MVSSRRSNPEKTLSEKIFTLPNAITALGGFLTWQGANNINHPSGVAQIIIGRTIDTIDGFVARATGQENEFGALFDAATDKVVTSKVMYELWKGSDTPKIVLGAIATFNTINAVATVAAECRQTDTKRRPVKTGKLAMAAETVSLFAHSIAHTIEQSGHNESSKLFRRIGNVAATAALPLAIHSSASYIKRAVKR